MTSWLGWLRRDRGTMTGEESEGEVLLADAFEQCPGKWLAVDRVTGLVRAADDNPDRLLAHLREQRITNVAVVRAPDVDEPELVGLG